MKKYKYFWERFIKLKKEENIKEEIIYSPMKGEIKLLEEVDDPVFASEILGRGVAIVPEEGKLISPFDGRVVSIFQTKHAINLISNNGCELFIHIGMDTVQLKGKYFQVLVKVGENIKKGQSLISFNIEKIKECGYNLQTPILVTNCDNYNNINKSLPKDIDFSQELIKIIK